MTKYRQITPQELHRRIVRAIPEINPEYVQGTTQDH
jgi:hypothetical protein